MALSMRSVSRFIKYSASIICALAAVVLLGGCSAVRLGYNNGPTLAYWWLDSYFDFDGEQSLRVRADLQAAQDWHRKEELPLLAQTLKGLQSMAPKPITSEQVCAVVAELQTRLQVTLDRMVPTIAAIAPHLQAAQIEHIAQEFDRRNRKWRDQWMDGTLPERTERRVTQIVDRAESFYGVLDAPQLAVVRAHVASSSLDAPRQLREMQRRQQDALQVLGRLRTSEANAGQATSEIRGLLERSLKAPDPAYRRYVDKLTTEGCAAMATLHNSSTSAQRTRLAQTLQDYEADARALANQRPLSLPLEQNPAPI